MHDAHACSAPAVLHRVQRAGTWLHKQPFVRNVTPQAASVLDKSTQVDLKKEVEKRGLADSGTQAAHGINYHHPEVGESGYQFFMPPRES